MLCGRRRSWYLRLQFLTPNPGCHGGCRRTWSSRQRVSPNSGASSGSASRTTTVGVVTQRSGTWPRSATWRASSPGADHTIWGSTLSKKWGAPPKALGVLMQIAGLSYLTNSFALPLAPTFADRIFPAILVPAFVGEASLCLWLLVKGVNVEKWKLQASAQPTRSAAATV